jgi:hypothetical protein
MSKISTAVKSLQASASEPQSEVAIFLRLENIHYLCFFFTFFFFFFYSLYVKIFLDNCFLSLAHKAFPSTSASKGISVVLYSTTYAIPQQLKHGSVNNPLYTSSNLGSTMNFASSGPVANSPSVFSAVNTSVSPQMPFPQSPLKPPVQGQSNQPISFVFSNIVSNVDVFFLLLILIYFS